ncbi:SDR family NAD(P)-dependent oxidoreductase [Arsenicicoccus dermatophilus]|uniref:SDR family NAD(P)-dependent oxidoreductase n=1 Tax=Arsenicicoccus dermatophilus TaxID=1076331 RepID=UPI003917068F
MPRLPFPSAPTATPDWLDGVVLITGASSGIGAALAREAASTAATVVLVARRRERLEALATELATVDRAGRAPLVVDVRPADLSTPQGVHGLAEDVRGAHGHVDVLVNNAGFGDYGLLEEADPERIARLVAVNVTAPTLLTRELLPGMVAQGRGAILMVGSSAGQTPTPGAVVYCASKYFVNGLSEGLRAELVGTGVTVTQLAPGPVATEFDEVSGMGPLTNAAGFARISAEQCAREAWVGLQAGAPLVYPGAVLRASMRASALLPQPALRPALARLGKQIRRDRGR